MWRGYKMIKMSCLIQNGRLTNKARLPRQAGNPSGASPMLPSDLQDSKKPALNDLPPKDWIYFIQLLGARIIQSRLFTASKPGQ
ncbi:hypothetical protein D6I95_12240 [Alcaligenes faecalis]|nr:hypothetical protein D6I95_12240 [Alcaligenes faecalis]